MLSREAVERSALRTQAAMGRNAAQVDKLVRLLAPDGTANLGSVLDALYKGQDQQAAMASLRQLRLEIQKAAKKAGVDFALAGDTKKKSAAASRLVWFEGEDLLVEATERWMAPNLAGPGNYTPSDAVKLGPVRVYLQYAPGDRADAERLIALLEPHFKARGIETWSAAQLLPGEVRSAEMQRQISQCDLTLQFLSPQLQASALLGEATPRRLPFLLHPVFEEPEDSTVFRYRGKSFSETTDKRLFAMGLFGKLLAVIEQRERGLAETLRELALHGEKYVVEGPASPISLARDIVPEASGVRCKAITFLEEWLADDKAPPYCALLGELGMGKTTTAKEFASGLWKRRKQGERVPVAIFLDLRYVGDSASDLDLDDIVARILKREWKSGAREVPPQPQEIYRLVENGALVIFDGLDEVLVHLTPSQGQNFTRQLFRIAPPAGGRGKLLITCRSHYFRNFKEQSAHFTLEDRDGVRAENYRALLLLPFGEEQIRLYLKNSLPGQDADKAYKFISTVHNLPELAERPYTLSLISKQFEKLEDWKASGKPVTGLTLYRFVVEEWLLRDGGKHQFTPEHKQMLMEHIAAELTRSGKRSWSIADLEQWMVEFVEARLAAHYVGIRRDLLKEDLRTATFLVREEDGDLFRFAHSSLQEYFLACYLRRALVAKDVAGWKLTGVSDETLDFLGQSLREQPSAEALRSLAAIRDQYTQHASELVFRYVVRAAGTGYPAPSAAGFQLAGANLRGVEVDHRQATPLVLRGANFRGACLANTFWRNCRFDGADFSDADGSRGEWQECELTDTVWANADLEGGLFRKCSLQGAHFDGANTYRSRWLLCPGSMSGQRIAAGASVVQVGHSGGVQGCAWSPDGRSVLSASWDGSLKIWDAATGDCLLTLSGHLSEVQGCAWSPDGRRVLSASEDESLKIWDAATGDCLLTLSGHSSRVQGCAWSPDGRRVLSDAWDKSLKIWDADAGDCLLTLSGHASAVHGCAWSPDGCRVLSASGDESLKIWDAATGDCLLTLSGHAREVAGCAWSPDGRRVLSASVDESLKIWDAGSGDCLLTLSGHAGWVQGCAWSPDGRRVVSAAWDNSVKIWDAAAGDCLLTLSGHSSGVQGCAWSGDGRRVVSASDDKSVKIWDAASGDCLLTLSGQSSHVQGCAWSPDGRRALSASGDRSLKIWDAASGDCLLTLSGHSSAVRGCAWSRDGRRVLSASWDKSLKIWDAASGDCLLTLSGHSSAVQACAWSRDGRRVLSASWDKSVKIWDAASGDCLLTLSGHWSSVYGCAWSPDGRRVLSASRDKSLKVWDAATGACLLTLSGHSNYVQGCAWSPDGRRVLSASADQSLKIWDAAAGDCLLTLSGHSSSVLGCAWSPDGRRVLSAAGDNTLKIWDAASGDCLLTTSTKSQPSSCSWSAQDRILVSFFDGSISIFDSSTLEESGPRCYHLSGPRTPSTWAALDPVKQRVLAQGEGAWRFVGQLVEDENGTPMWLPLEAFVDGEG